MTTLHLEQRGAWASRRDLGLSCGVIICDRELWRAEVVLPLQPPHLHH